MLLIPFLILAILISWSRTYRPGMGRLEGTVIHVRRVPLLARIRMHGTATVITVGLALVFLMLEPGWWWIAAIGLVSAISLFAVPVSYTMTDLGIRLGKSSFRRWTEFAAVRRAPGGARLIGVPKSRGMHIWLSGSRGDDEFLQFLRQTLKGAYKGTSARSDQHQVERVANPDQDGGTEVFAMVSASH